jgi:hypothetical protein
MLDNDARLIIEILTHSSKSYYEADSAEEFIGVCAGVAILTVTRGRVT